MKQIKLEVGKTYRNRRGEEVKIVEKNGKGRYPYNGSDGQLYAENGKYIFDVEEDPDDLIEEVKEVPEPRYTFITPDDMKEVTSTRFTFAIPDGATKLTVEQVSNRVVVEMVPEVETPKPGDVMIDNKGNVYIFKSVVNSDIHKHYAWFGKDGRLVIGSMCTPGRPATPEEAQPLWDALEKPGKRWNAETMQVEDLPEIYRILEWVEENIKDGYYNQEDVAEAIEGYLKQKEAKK